MWYLGRTQLSSRGLVGQGGQRPRVGVQRENPRGLFISLYSAARLSLSMVVADGAVQSHSLSLKKPQTIDQDLPYESHFKLNCSQTVKRLD